ncbi:LysR family transcriptional regulator [Rhizobium sp. VS19-DR104.2]|uniref:LysR family transcriptional regulator n=1 Tax=unclassified Rhizobium TaxID=2613769 RepID=UPI001C5A6559|nr:MULTISPECIES: LysR family transcriptional regulator [unclassified Rhizobium]MBZ5763280.1 LysR family transcriptional regulator [Rhizobium sp. VS19-DR96]MBZ5769683.1 LysR family transcriptional regulator [Rhizobium sp. VS19-DR129.2]MBZ5777214.1 LysR family transcriptional regulator [Rhizobium sp. VS19-DRK62.2]MBZ5787849.1 LysR family transcriptional regulator [Rhizobium sp. VS19-DR121]MBZ5805338.1 LysR family transcriptional regulator [Rhizobium sp. VS19-DR181]
MLDGLSLDQLRTFVAAADEGSFSAAGRRLRRTQSAVSETIANLEAQLAVMLFDRTGRYPRLTAQGNALLVDARSVVSAVDGMKARAKGIAGGLEPELSAVIDVFFPISVIADVSHEFRREFPATPLRLYVEALGGAVQPLIDGRASFGLVVSLPTLPSGLVGEGLASVEFVMVAASTHPLAAYEGLIPRQDLARHVQLVLADRTDLSAGRECGVMSPLIWRLADLFAKHAFLISGLGWGGMPLHAVRKHIEEGRLVQLSIQDIPPGGLKLPMSAVYRVDAPPGPAGRWMIDRLKQCSGTKC